MSEDREKYDYTMATAYSVNLDNQYTVGRFSPLCLSFKNGDREWTLDFQSKPVSRISRIGVMPTRDELVDVLSYTHFPVTFIPVLEVILATCEVQV